MAAVVVAKLQYRDTLPVDECKKLVEDFMENGQGVYGHGAAEEQNTTFYDMDYVSLDLNKLREMLNDSIDSLDSLKGGGPGMTGGANIYEMATMLRTLLFGQRTPVQLTYLDRLIWFRNIAGNSFNVVYDLLHGRAPARNPTILDQIYSLSTYTAAHGAAVRAAVADAVHATAGVARAAAAFGHAAEGRLHDYPLRLFYTPDRAAMILIMIKNITAEQWVIIGTAGYTAGAFLLRMNAKLQEKLESRAALARAAAAAHAAEMYETDKSDAVTAGEVFLGMSSQILEEHVNDMVKDKMPEDKDVFEGSTTGNLNEALTNMNKVVAEANTNKLAAAESEMEKAITLEYFGIGTQDAPPGLPGAPGLPEAAAPWTVPAAAGTMDSTSSSTTTKGTRPFDE